jgi:hypothetical protein
VPTPNPGESQSAFVSRYVGSKESVARFPQQKQRIAVAYSEFEQHQKKMRKMRSKMMKKSGSMK